MQTSNLIIIYHPDRPKRLTTFKDGYIEVFNKANTTYVLPFISKSDEGDLALSLIIDNKKIKMFHDSFYQNYKNTVFLFTGSKEMVDIIKKLMIFL